MALELYPADVRGLKFTVNRRQMWETLIQTAPTSNETRIGQRQNPQWKWTLMYDYLYNTVDSTTNNVPLAGRDYPDKQILEGFYGMHRGMHKTFLFEDPDDKTVGPALISAAPNLKAQLQLVQDEDTLLWYSPVQRKLGGMFWEDITDLNGAITVYANGVLQLEGVHYSVGGPGFAIPGRSWAGRVLAWADGYEPAGPITAEFDFYFRVRFDTDEQDFEKFLDNLFTIGGHGKNGRGTLEIKSVPPPMCDEGVEAPEAILVSGCGSFTGEWRFNARVGPFPGAADEEWFGIFMVADRLVAVYSADNMETWAIVDDVHTPPAVDIGSFDSEEKGADDIIAATQELNPSGRVAYSRFSRDDGEWKAVDKEVVAAADIGTGTEACTVSITTRSTGAIVIAYDTDRETLEGDALKRFGYRTSTDDGDTWSAEQPVGRWGEHDGETFFGTTGLATDTLARVIADNAGRLHFAFGDTQPPLFGRWFTQTLTAGDVLNARVLQATGTGGSQIQVPRVIGDYCTFIDGGTFKIAVPMRRTSRGVYKVFDTGDNLTVFSGTEITGEPTIFQGVGGAYCPMMSMRELDGVLHAIGEKFDNDFGAFLWHKTVVSPYLAAAWTPSAQHANQAGPIFDAVFSGQHIGATVRTIDGNDYLASFQSKNSGSPNVIASLIPLNRLPLPTSLTLTQWLAECNIQEGG